MKYYVFDVETYTDGTKDSPAVYTYEKLDDAVAAFHSKVGGAMKRENIASVTCMVIDSACGIHKSEAWAKEQK